MSTRPFRFGVGVALLPDASSFFATARRIEELGYSSMVTAHALSLPSPFSSLGAAAAATSSLRLGTQVLAVPLCSPAGVAHDTETLDLLSDRRFELGLGTGAPDIAADAERLGKAFGSGRERLALLAETITAVKQRFAEKNRPPPGVLLGGTGPKLTELAAAEADTLAIPVPYDRPEEDLVAKVGELRNLVGAGRFDRLELAISLMSVGEQELPEWVPVPFQNLPADSYGRIDGKPAEIADVLRRRRDLTGISYVTIPQMFLEYFAPVVELLADT